MTDPRDLASAELVAARSDRALEDRAALHASTHPESRDIITDLLDRLADYRVTLAAIARDRNPEL